MPEEKNKVPSVPQDVIFEGQRRKIVSEIIKTINILGAGFCKFYNLDIDITFKIDIKKPGQKIITPPPAGGILLPKQN